MCIKHDKAFSVMEKIGTFAWSHKARHCASYNSVSRPLNHIKHPVKTKVPHTVLVIIAMNLANLEEQQMVEEQQALLEY